MTCKFILLCALGCSIQIAFAQTNWPASPSEYSYFGAPTLNQSVYGNYAALQDKNNGTTFFNSPVEIHFRINNSPRMFLSNAGNFGIGTTAPSAPLHVAGSGQGSHLTIETNSNGEGDLTWIQGGVARAAFQVNQTSGDFEAWVSGSVWQRWLQVNRMNGNAGIGTVPSYKFHIKNPDLQLVLQTDGTGNNRSIIAFGDAAGTLQGSFGLFGADGSIRIGDAMDYCLVVKQGGNVGIGTTSPTQKLTVNGTIYGKQVKVDLSVPGPDYVFEKSYSLPALVQVESYIDENKHLPEVPSAKEMEANGINVGEMNMLLLKKVEELTLYMIEANKRIDDANKKIGILENAIKER